MSRDGESRGARKGAEFPRVTARRGSPLGTICAFCYTIPIDFPPDMSPGERAEVLVRLPSGPRDPAKVQEVIDEVMENRRRPKTAYVYLVTDGTAVKIGVARNIPARIASLQTGNPRLIALIGRIRFGSINQAYAGERVVPGCSGSRL